MTVQIAGPIGPFLDNVQQRQVAVMVMASKASAAAKITGAP